MPNRCPEWIVRAADQQTMRDFIAGFADYYRTADVLVLIDLYPAEQLPRGDAQRVFDDLRERAVREASSRPDTRSRPARMPFGRDPLMGFEMDFSTADRRTAFATVAALAINSEAWLDGIQILGAADGAGEVWVRIPADALAEVIRGTSHPDSLDVREF
jgi:hypothetical protein